MEERRSCARWEIEIRGSCWSDTCPEYTPLLVKDINFKGAGVLMRERPLEDTALYLNLELVNAGPPISCSARVVWTKEREDREDFPLSAGLTWLNFKDVDK